MLHVKVICIGKLKESYLREAQEEYQKRLGAYCRLEILELPEYRLPPDPSGAEIDRGLSEEGKRILQKAGGMLIPLCIEGKELSSPELAQEIAQRSLTGESCISFIIGGSFGLAEDVKRQASLRLSMSPMTFPHQLARIMLLEQLYRAFSINANTKYHK